MYVCNHFIPQNAGRVLFVYVLVFIIIFLAFGGLFVVRYGQFVYGFRNIIQTFKTCTLVTFGFLVSSQRKSLYGK